MNQEPLPKSIYNDLMHQPEDGNPPVLEDPKTVASSKAVQTVGSNPVVQAAEFSKAQEVPAQPQPSLRHGLKVAGEALRNDVKEVGGKLEEMAKDATEVMRSGFSGVGKAIGKWLGVSPSKS